MLLFQVIFPVLSPIGDFVFLLAVIRGDAAAVVSGYVLFLLMDLAGSLLAFTLERRPRRLIWVVLIQRFFYRQFMYVITFRTLIAILRGGRHGWNKLVRRDSVPYAAPHVATTSRGRLRAASGSPRKRPRAVMRQR
jgi:hypothetical protein